MVYIKLFISFIKIGLFSFGGGYAMIPLIQKEIESHGWLTSSQFADIIAIAEMTPGPIAVNSATFVGYKIAGFFGGMVATLGVAIPSLVLVLIISRFFLKFKENKYNSAVFYGIRPVIVALIATAAMFVAETSIFKSAFSFEMLKHMMLKPFDIIDIGSLVILIVTLVALVKYKINPILAIACSGVLGVLIFYVL